jgi:hypothetical protein
LHTAIVLNLFLAFSCQVCCSDVTFCTLDEDQGLPAGGALPCQARGLGHRVPRAPRHLTERVPERRRLASAANASAWRTRQLPGGSRHGEVDNANGQVQAVGMQFGANGYAVEGNPIVLVVDSVQAGLQSIIRAATARREGRPMSPPSLPASPAARR